MLAKMNSLIRKLKEYYLVGDKHFIKHDEKKNIVIQIDSFDRGGLEEVVLSLIKGISKNKAINLYLFIVGSDIGYLGKEAVDNLDNGRVFLLKHDIQLLEKLIKEIKPVIVNTHYSTFGYEIYKKFNVKIVDTIHNNYIWLKNERDDFNQAVAKFIAVSSQVKDCYSRKFSVDSDKIVVIPNGLDANKITIKNITRAEMGFSESDFIFINIASFNYNKGHILLVNAFKQVLDKHTNAKLIMAGNVMDKECYDNVISFIKSNNLSQSIKILDYVPKDTVYGILSIADCFVFPSLIEGWSIAVMEAMYANLPLIMTDIGSARDVIENGDIGTIIKLPYDDVTVLNNDDIYHKYRTIDNYKNLDNLVVAMEEKITSADKKYFSENNYPKMKIVNRFNLTNNISSYLNVFRNIIHEK